MKEIILFIHFAINLYDGNHKDTRESTDMLPNEFELAGLRAGKLYSKPNARAKKLRLTLQLASQIIHERLEPIKAKEDP